MKIKELHLRNIASIERADIDFENGLNDAITRLPASIFLISGDTGAGKSVLLDGIALALYKKTPRTEGVANKTRNEFVDREGESISINSIEQYTRLGISEKEECYSEVVFEGNDGLEYRAKLELGMSRGNRDKDTGKRALKHRSPAWMVQVGNGDWQRVEAKTGQPILGAVGLSFEQFGRMAMLAQGQFASFLTGDKKERESILEQLTNTEHFSEYGTAISSLFARAKEGREQAQQVYDTEKQHTLEPEEVQQLTADQQRLNVEQQALEKERRAVEDRLKLIDLVEQNARLRRQALEEQAKLEALMASEEYRKKVSLVTDWDTTDAVRQHWKDAQVASLRKAEEEKKLLGWKEVFLQLAADEAFRKDAQDLLRMSCNELNNWLLTQADREELYAQEAVLHERWKQLREMQQKRKMTAERLLAEEGRTAGLLVEAQRAAEAVQQAQLQLEQHDLLTSDWKRKREESKPQEVNEALEACHRRSTRLVNFQSQWQHWLGVKTRAEEVSADLARDAQAFTAAEQALVESNVLYASARKEHEKVQSLLATMKLSVEETLKELRQRLLREQADTCPLCGQPLRGLMADEEFLHMLSPLQQTEQETALRLQEVEKKREEAKGGYDRLKGTLEANRRTLASLQADLKQITEGLQQEAKALEMDLTQPLMAQCEVQQQRVQIQMASLREAQHKVQAIQQEIDRLDGLRKGLDEAKRKADLARISADKVVDQNGQAIQNLQAGMKECDAGIEALVALLLPVLQPFYPNWQVEDVQAEQMLTREADFYRKQQLAWEEGQKKMERAQGVLDAIATLRNHILSLQPDWLSLTEGVQPMAFVSSQSLVREVSQPTVREISQPAVRDIQMEWTDLLKGVNACRTQWSESDRLGREATQALEVYYAQSGKTAEDLVHLLTQEAQIVQVRTYLNERQAESKSCRDAVERANSIIREALVKGGVPTEADLPQPDLLHEQGEQLALCIQQRMEQLGSIKSRLELNRQNVQRLQACALQLALAEKRFLKWDKIHRVFGGTRFRTLVQTYILHPLLNNANIYLEKITDRYLLTCTEENEQLSILVLDRYNKNQVRSVTVLSGGERFMISLALSLALSSLNRPDMNVNILFIDEGFGTLDEKNLDSVMSTLEKLQEIAGQSNRRVGIISHREELNERLPVQIQVTKKGEGRSHVSLKGCISEE